LRLLQVGVFSAGRGETVFQRAAEIVQVIHPDRISGWYAEQGFAIGGDGLIQGSDVVVATGAQLQGIAEAGQSVGTVCVGQGGDREGFPMRRDCFAESGGVARVTKPCRQDRAEVCQVKPPPRAVGAARPDGLPQEVDGLLQVSHVPREFEPMMVCGTQVGQHARPPGLVSRGGLDRLQGGADGFLQIGGVASHSVPPLQAHTEVVELHRPVGFTRREERYGFPVHGDRLVQYPRVLAPLVAMVKVVAETGQEHRSRGSLPRVGRAGRDQCDAFAVRRDRLVQGGDVLRVLIPYPQCVTERRHDTGANVIGRADLALSVSADPDRLVQDGDSAGHVEMRVEIVEQPGTDSYRQESRPLWSGEAADQEDDSVGDEALP